MALLKRSHRGLAFWALFAAILSLTSCGHFKQVEVEEPPPGRAKYDPFFAASRFVEQMGLPSTSQNVLPPLPPEAGSILVLPVSLLQSTFILQSLERWVREEGGHLICFLEHGREKAPPDPLSWQAFLAYWEIDYQEEDKYPAPQITSYTPIPSQAERAGEYETDFSVKWLLRWEGEEDRLLSPSVQKSHGRGSVALWSTFAPFTNQNIGEAQHASLLWDELQGKDAPKVTFVYGKVQSFFALLWNDAALAIGCALALTAFLGWSLIKRFGPIFAFPKDGAPQLYDHFEASGSLFLRSGATELLLAEVQANLYSKLAKRCSLPLDSSPEMIRSYALQRGHLTDAETELLTQNFPVKPTERRLYLSQLQPLFKRYGLL